MTLQQLKDLLTLCQDPEKDYSKALSALLAYIGDKDVEVFFAKQQWI
jgi:hypothetical protein